MSTARVRPQNVEKVWKTIHGNGLIGPNATHSVPMLLQACAFFSKHRIPFPLSELKARCQNLVDDKYSTERMLHCSTYYKVHFVLLA